MLGVEAKLNIRIGMWERSCKLEVTDLKRTDNSEGTFLCLNAWGIWCSFKVVAEQFVYKYNNGNTVQLAYSSFITH